MEELIKRVEEQYSNGNYEAILETVTEMNEFVESLNNVISELNSEKDKLNADITRITEENKALRSTNAGLFLKANGREASDPKPEPVATDYSAMINPDDFRI